jgi:hypothetical protein
VLATLNPPNIAAVYGFEESPAATGIVLESWKDRRWRTRSHTGHGLRNAAGQNPNSKESQR